MGRLSYSTAEIDELLGKVDQGGAIPQACDPDNWYFLSAAVINQRGVSGTISTPGYFIDRWKLSSGNVTIGSAGLMLSGEIVQIVDNAYPNIRTVTALATDGSLIDGVWDASSSTVSYSASGKTIQAVDFAPGDVPIRFRKSGGVWGLVSAAPNYQQELAKCQRYQVVVSFNVGTALSTSVSDGNGEVWFPLSLPVTPRANGTFTLMSGQLRVHGIGGNYINVTPGSTVLVQGSVANILVSGLTSLAAYTLDAYPAGAFLLDFNL